MPEANVAGILTENAIKALVREPAMPGIATIGQDVAEAETTFTSQTLAKYLRVVNQQGTLSQMVATDIVAIEGHVKDLITRRSLQGETNLFLSISSSAVEGFTDIFTGVNIATTNIGKVIAAVAKTSQRQAGHYVLDEALEIQDDPDNSRVLIFGAPTESIPESIIQNWQLLATSGLSEESYLSLLRLARKSPGWRGDGSRSLDYKSLENFLQFWKSVREKSVEPEFGLVPNGNLRVEWYKDNRHFVELEFRADDDCIFGIFDGKSVFEGRASVKNIIEVLATRDFGPLKWSYGG
jgi:hypothetical protein